MRKIVLTLCLLCWVSIINAQAPANDDCANAVSLTVGAACIPGTTVNSTFDGIIPSCAGPGSDGNVWYQFTATSLQSKIDVSNVVGLDIILAVYSTCGGASIECSDIAAFGADESILFPTIIGTTYLISVKQYDASPGTFCIKVSDILPPTNDNCVNAINLTVGAPCASGTTVLSTFDGTIPSCGSTASTGNVWYQFTATAAHSKINLTNVSNFDAVLSVYASCGGSSLQCVNAMAGNGDESLFFTTVIATTYLINVKQNTTAAGTFCIDVMDVFPPFNDDCANAINLIVDIPCTAGTTILSTSDGTIPSCGGGANTGNVWYQYTATSTLSNVTVTNAVGGLDVVLGIYSSCGGNSINCVDDGIANEDETITFATVIGTTYLINIKQYSTAAGTFCVEVANVIPPVNDNCTNAINLTVGVVCTWGTTVNSTFDGTMPSCGGLNNEGNVWYQFTATSTKSKIDITGISGFDAVLSVYDTCGGASIQCINAGGSGVNESVLFTTVVGTTYLINVKQNTAAAGTFCIEVNDVISPANDDCANAINLTVGSVCTSGTTINSTFDGTMPSCGGSANTGNVWYQFTATSALSNVNVTTVAGGLDVVLSIYGICGGASLQCVDAGISNAGETKTFVTVIGTTYFISVKQYGNSGGTFCVEVKNIIPPVNDGCVNAISLTIGAACTSGTVVNSIFDGTLPSCGGTANTGNVWYKFTATSLQSRVDLTSVSGFDAVLAIYAVCGGNSIECSDASASSGNESKVFSTVIGTTYLINVKQYSATAGTFCISANDLTPPANDTCVNAINLTVGAACLSGTTVNSTFDGTLPSCGGTSSTGNVWYQFTATTQQSRVDLTSVSGFDAVLAIYAACGGNSIECTDAGASGGNESKTFSTIIGTTYLVGVKQYGITAGTFCISVNNLLPPVNDSCAKAISLTVGAACTSGTVFNSTFDGNIPSCGSTTLSGNVWYQFTATSVQSRVDVISVSGFDAVVAIYSSCGGNSVQCEDGGLSNQNETISFATVIGTTYLINVKQTNASAGTFCIAVSDVLIPPANDSCANAINLVVGSACTSGTTINSTFDGTLPSCGGTANTGNVWYQFTATGTQSKIDVTNVSGFDAVLAIYSSCSGNSVECADGGLSNQNELVSFATVIGTTYLINVKQLDTSAGAFCIEVNNDSGSSINNLLNPIIALYPNPTSNNTIKVECNKFVGPVNAIITNTLGQTVKSIIINKNMEVINLSDINNGTYFLQIPEWNVSKMIMKN